MKTDIFHLEIIALKDIYPHEEFDSGRSLPLAEKIKKEKILKNPIIVTAIGKGKFIQLDGMNRLSAFKALGFNSICAQIIDYNDQENVELASWLHLFKGDQKNILEKISLIDGLSVQDGEIAEVKNRYIQSEGSGRIASIVNADKKVWHIACSGDLLNKLKALNRLVSLYEERIIRDILPSHAGREDIVIIFKEHTDCNLMAVFPIFTRHQIVKAVRKGGLFPPGITRHIIKRRCMTVNLPIELFNKNQPISKLNEFLTDNLLQRKFRLYEEPTIYFE